MPKPRTPIVLAAGVRSAQARAGGVFAREDAAHLAAEVVRELIARTNLDPATIDEVIAGCAGPPHDQANVARVLALRAGIPRSVPARTVARNCASGMEAITSAATEIAAGIGELYVVCGVEIMSKFPLIVSEKMTTLFSRLASAGLRSSGCFRGSRRPTVTPKNMPTTIEMGKMAMNFSGPNTSPTCRRPAAKKPVKQPSTPPSSVVWKRAA